MTNPFRKLRTRYVLLAIDVVLMVPAVLSLLGERHPLGSRGHIALLGLAGLLIASITADRFLLLKLYADQPDHEEVRGLL